ncbi:MAG: hypothetical protein LBV71_11740 [Prevotella sp.]|jgi:hypothetical protein|nr:hypothetical protein [Prevotella sp.]
MKIINYYKHLKIKKSDKNNIRFNKKHHRKDLKRKTKKKLRKLILINAPKRISDLNNFLAVNKSYIDFFIKKRESKHAVKCQELDLFVNPGEVFNIILKLLINPNPQFSLNFNNVKVGFGALFLIDTIGWHLSRYKTWGLHTSGMNKTQSELFHNMRTHKSQDEDYAMSSIVNEPVKIDRREEAVLTTKNYDKVSKRLRELTELGIQQKSGNKDFKLDKKTNEVIHSVISEQFDNIYQHAKNAKFGDICATYNKETNTISVLIYNFGPSIAETFLVNQVPEEVSDFIRTVVENHRKKSFFNYFGKEKFTEENVLTLLSLQAGVSSLLDEDKTRGYGLIDFIEHCFTLSNSSRVVLTSGKTTIKIDNKYKITDQEILNRERKVLTLNTSGSIFDKPDSEYVLNHDYTFPGVIIETTIPL